MNYYIYSLFLLFPYGVFAQAPPCISCFEQNPSSVTITDPARYNEMIPCSSETGISPYQYFYQRNRFKWYENSPAGVWEFKIKKLLSPGGNTYMVDPVTS